MKITKIDGNFRLTTAEQFAPIAAHRSQAFPFALESISFLCKLSTWNIALFSGYVTLTFDRMLLVESVPSTFETLSGKNKHTHNKCKGFETNIII